VHLLIEEKSITFQISNNRCAWRWFVVKLSFMQACYRHEGPGFVSLAKPYKVKGQAAPAFYRVIQGGTHNIKQTNKKRGKNVCYEYDQESLFVALSN
jgi:hypothetical protein